MQGGRAAGHPPVQVRTGRYAEGLTGNADHEVDSVADLSALLRRLTAA